MVAMPHILRHDLSYLDGQEIKFTKWRRIFALAIDYEVVVSGVRSKYGQNVSEEKCRSFFDKIIQLPFRLPVESYRLEGLIRETVEDDILEEDIDPLTNVRQR